jgi:hypothetical protein
MMEAKETAAKLEGDIEVKKPGPAGRSLFPFCDPDHTLKPRGQVSFRADFPAWMERAS